ncbi:hypothetical protein SprV_0401613500 [Sparganum proliferum]
MREVTAPQTLMSELNERRPSQHHRRPAISRALYYLSGEGLSSAEPLEPSLNANKSFGTLPLEDETHVGVLRTGIISGVLVQGNVASRSFASEASTSRRADLQPLERTCVHSVADVRASLEHPPSPLRTQHKPCENDTAANATSAKWTPHELALQTYKSSCHHCLTNSQT